MFEKNMNYAYLVDVYGDLLDPHAKAVMDAYYNEDLSLAEIADGEGISRQGVRHIIKRSEELLDGYEASLHLSQTDRALSDALTRLTQLEQRLRTMGDAASAEADELARIACIIRNSR